MPTNQNPCHRTAGPVVAGLALGAALAWLGTVSDAASAAAGGVLAGVVLALQARRRATAVREVAQPADRRAARSVTELRARRAQDQ